MGPEKGRVGQPVRSCLQKITVCLMPCGSCGYSWPEDQSPCLMPMRELRLQLARAQKVGQRSPRSCLHQSLFDALIAVTVGPRFQPILYSQTGPCARWRSSGPPPFPPCLLFMV